MNNEFENKTRKLTEEEHEIIERLTNYAFALIEAMYEYEIKK